MRASFVAKHEDKWPELARGRNIRSHSGRRHAISAMADGGVPENAGMWWSQILKPEVYRGYIEPDPSRLRRAVAKFAAAQR